MNRVLFGFIESDEERINFGATSEEFWKAEGCLDDQFRDKHLGVDIPGVSNTMEACFEIDSEHATNIEEAKTYLESFGLTFSQEMQDFLK